MNRPIILGKTYFFSHDENRMQNEGNLAQAREFFLKTRFKNLDYLLKKRYDWMNDYISSNDYVVEIGSGAGFSRLYLKNNITITDTVLSPWIDKKIDALNMDFDDSSIDVIIASHTIHHFAYQYKFLIECLRVLKPSEKVIICDIYTGLFMRFLLRLMRHEGWSYDVDVFDKDAIANDPRDPWSANCAIPQLLFDDDKCIEKNIFLNVDDKIATFDIIHKKNASVYYSLFLEGSLQKQ